MLSWWCTIFAAVIIFVRLGGRLVRNDMLFREDKIMLASVVPLVARMAFVHVVLIWGTNNANLATVNDPTDLYHRQIGSRLVLAARVFYAMFIWMAKFTVLDFLKRMTERFWKRSFEIGMQFITWYLVATFVAVVLSTILECHPTSHYWQVKPFPGSQCTQAFAQLVSRGGFATRRNGD
ncbi:MAG: hypothetical protein INR71_12670 [Terriglobus roseus]|nr:hypothetical protein [Terriglobus roseus]